MKKKPKTREEIAAIEVGETDVAPRLAWFLSVVFLGLIFAVPILDQWILSDPASNQSDSHSLTEDLVELLPSPSRMVSDTREHGLVKALSMTNAKMLGDIKDLETNLEDSSTLANRVIPPTQHLLVETLNAGTENVYVGREDWLYFRPAMDSIWGPGFLNPKVLKARSNQGDENNTPPEPDPRKAILEFRDQLAAKGIELMIVPAPAKASIHPEYFSHSGSFEHQVENRDYEALLTDLKDSGIVVCDLGDLLFKNKDQVPLYLKTDTHWNPQGVSLAAQAIAKQIEQSGILNSAPYQNFSQTPETVSNKGDIAAMLRIPEEDNPYKQETATIQVIRDAYDQEWKSDSKAEILLLGDSFSNIFTLESMGWGHSAGLPAQLSYELQRPIETILRNDSGAYATRLQLASDMARGDNRLAGKKLVIWEFASRELALGDWKTGLLLELQEARSTDRQTDEPSIVTGNVAAITQPPRAGSVPYKDCVISILLRDPIDQASGQPLEDIVVFGMGMKDNEWQSLTALEVGETVTLSLDAWTKVESEYGSYNRIELDSSEALFMPLYWTNGYDPKTPIEFLSGTTDTTLEPENLTKLSDLIDSPWKSKLISRINEMEQKDETVHIGNGGWMFFRPELRHLAVGTFWNERAQEVSRASNPDYADPLPAILDFKNQLDQAGIELILMPIPPKASILSDKVFASPVEGESELTQSESTVLRRWYARLRAEGIRVLDLTETFTSTTEQHDGFYCKLDTHWNGHACIAAAELAAQTLKEIADFSDLEKRTYRVEEKRISITGDLANSLKSNQTESLFLEKVWETTPAGDQAPGTWRESPVLLLADSHGLVFHAGGDMFETQAGLADHLAMNLGFPVDLLAVRGSGATPTRMSLLRRGDNLEGKKAVVWAFTAREFTESVGGWRKLPIIQTDRPTTNQETGTDSVVPPTNLINSSDASSSSAQFEGSIWNFRTANDPVLAFATNREPLPNVTLNPSGSAHVSRSGWLVLHQGSFEEESGAEFLSNNLRAENAISLESIIRPFNKDQTRAAVISVGGSYFLMQEQNRIDFIFSTPRGVQKMPIQLPVGNQPTHLLVSYGSEHGFNAYVNGQLQEPSGQKFGELIPGRVDGITLGNSSAKDRPWSGMMTGTAIYSEETDQSSAKTRYSRAKRFLDQQPPEGYLHLTARLTAKSHIPTLSELAPYTENLTVFEYQVQDISNSDYSGNVIYVAHWAILDSQHLPWMTNVALNEEVGLILQGFQNNPALEGVNLSDTVITDFTLPLFYDASGQVFDTNVDKDFFVSSPEHTVSFARNKVSKSIYGLFSEQEADARSQRIVRDLDQLNTIVESNGGYENWRSQLETFRQTLFNHYKDLNKTYIDLGNGVYSSRSQVDYLRLHSDYPKFSSSDWHDGAKAEESIIEFSKQLRNLGMDLILMPIPTQTDLYPERFAAISGITHPNPERIRLLQNLMEAGVEVLDLTPTFRSYQEADPLFIPTDIHWNTPAIRLAASEIAKRLSNYNSIKDLQNQKMSYSVETDRITYKNGFFLRNADESLRSSETGNPIVLRDTIKTESGEIYDQYYSKTPVLIIGDSFTHIFAYTGGDLAGQLAKVLGIPVARISKGGAGPYAPRLFASQKSEDMESRRVVIWAFSSEFLFSRENQWSVISLDP